MSAAAAPRLLPPPASSVVVQEDALLTIETVNDGALLDDANDALAKAIKEAVKRKGKSKVTLVITVGPGGKDMPEAMKVTGSVTLALPKIESAKMVLPTPDGKITTDLKSIRKVLRPISGGQFEDVRTGEVVDAQGASLPALPR
jgi:hypothetical protein